MTYPTNRKSRHLVYNFLGQECGQLAVFAKGEKNNRHEQLWRCRCSCGNETTASTSQLVNGQKKSCGCLDSAGNPAKRCPHPAASLGPGIAARNKLLAQYKRQATKRGHEWALTNEACLALFAGNCFYCGEPPQQKFTTGVPNTFTGAFVYNGIDRVDNRYGYRPDNAVSCCGVCNRVKGSMTKDDFFGWLMKVYNYGFVLEEAARKREIVA